MKIFENNAIKQILLYVVSGATIALVVVLLFFMQKNFKTQNQHKSLTHFFVKDNKAFAKRAAVEEVVAYGPPTKQVQSIENFTALRKIKIYGFKATPPKKRDKRFILFNDGGVVKLVLGTSYPVTLSDPLRSLSIFYNFHLQYTPPPIPLYWWSLYNTTTFPASSKKKRQTHMQQNKKDVSREIIYEAIKGFIERTGLPGEECLLQMICEISATPFHVAPNGNIFHELLNAIFIPTAENVNQKYWNAFHAGHNGAMCDYACPKEINWLKRNTILY